MRRLVEGSEFHLELKAALLISFAGVRSPPNWDLPGQRQRDVAAHKIIDMLGKHSRHEL